LVDAHGSGPCAARCGGSSPSVGTKVFSAKFGAKVLVQKASKIKLDQTVSNGSS
jgi:hypothetical protein